MTFDDIGGRPTAGYHHVVRPGICLVNMVARDKIRRTSCSFHAIFMSFSCHLMPLKLRFDGSLEPVNCLSANLSLPSVYVSCRHEPRYPRPASNKARIPLGNTPSTSWIQDPFSWMVRTWPFRYCCTLYSVYVFYLQVVNIPRPLRVD